MGGMPPNLIKRKKHRGNIYAARGDWHAVYNYGANEYIPNDGKFPTGLAAVALNFEIYDEKTGELKFGLEQIENDMVSVLDD